MSQPSLAQLLIKAQEAEQAYEWQEARQQYEQALSLQPENGQIEVALNQLDSLVNREEYVCQLMEEGDKQLASHDYARALRLYRQAYNHAGQANILKYHATLDVKKSQAGELLGWKTRVDEEITIAQRRSKQGDDNRALAELAQLLKELPSDPLYANLTTQTDAALKRLKKQLEERKQEKATDLLRQAERATVAGDSKQVLELLRQASELWPENEEIKKRSARVQRRTLLEQKLQQAQLDAKTKQGTSSLPDARDALERALNILLATKEELPDEARHILLSLIQVGSQEEGLALGKDEHWQKAQALLSDLSQQQTGTLYWALPYAHRLAGQWAHLAHYIALRGIINSSIQLGHVIDAYRAARINVRAYLSEVTKTDSQMAKEALLKSLNNSAGKRIERAKKAYQRGEYQLALDNLESLQRAVYLPVEDEFGDVLDENTEQIRAEAEQLRTQAQRLQALHERAFPLLVAAEKLFIEGQLKDAEARLRFMPDIDELTHLARKLDNLRAMVARARREQSTQMLQKLMIRAQITLTTASRVDDLDHLRGQLEKLPAELELQLVPSDDQKHYYELLEEVRQEQQLQHAAAAWEAQATKWIERKEYILAERALKQALPAIRRAYKQVMLNILLEEVQDKAERQRQGEEAIQQGRDFLIQGDYLQARRELWRAQNGGADVKALLDSARAGVLLQSAKRTWQEEQEWESANEELEEALKLANSSPEGEDLAREIRRWQRGVKRERDSQKTISSG